jgi:DNA-binding NtrC family response regulator
MGTQSHRNKSKSSNRSRCYEENGVKKSGNFGLGSALDFLRAQKTPVVLCETDLRPGTWRELLEEITHAPDAPAVIVSSRLADDRLWAEALNLGAWDVLARPFVASEVFHAVSAAWRHWRNQHENSTTVVKVMRAAGWGATVAAAGSGA